MIPTSDSKLSVDPPLVVQVINSDSFVVDPTLPSKSEVKVVESVSSPPNPTLSSESAKTKVVTLTQYLSHLPVETELKLTQVFVVSRIVLEKGKSIMFQ